MNDENRKYKCVLCDKEVPLDINTYIDGAGQLCSDCYGRVYD
jgi:DNA-directed RNA polymerase subunit RPC12/RpoP